MSSEERNREEPDERLPEHGDQEPVEEAQGSPDDPAAFAEAASAETPDADDEPRDSSSERASAGENGADAEKELSALTAELETTRRERDEYLDALKRIKAEFENSRKRQERERVRILQTASEQLVAQLLPVLDNLERALESEGDIRDGVRATREQLVDVLEREGLVPVASDGQHFDPNVHEAVMGQVSEEHAQGTIIQTFERGYVLNGKPIRPAKVVVAS